MEELTISNVGTGGGRLQDNCVSEMAPNKNAMPTALNRAVDVGRRPTQCPAGGMSLVVRRSHIESYGTFASRIEQ